MQFHDNRKCGLELLSQPMIVAFGAQVDEIVCGRRVGLMLTHTVLQSPNAVSWGCRTLAG